MKKILIIGVLLLLPSFTPSIFAGNINLTTYYPSPHGVYDRIRLLPRADLSGSCQIGMLYSDSTGIINSCKDAGGGIGAFNSIIQAHWSKNGTDIHQVDLNARVGIGTNAPSEALDVNGNVLVSSNIYASGITIGNSLTSFNVSCNTLNVARLTVEDLYASTAVVSTPQITTTNLFSSRLAVENLNVTSSSSHSEITASGDIVIAGDLIANGTLYPSDRNLKKNILTIVDPVTKTMALRGVSFDWKKNKRSSIGFIAQEVEEILPELVSTNHAGEKAVRYENLVALLTEAIKQQQKQINQLMKTHQKKQKMINELEKKLK